MVQEQALFLSCPRRNSHEHKVYTSADRLSSVHFLIVSLSALHFWERIEDLRFEEKWTLGVADWGGQEGGARERLLSLPALQPAAVPRDSCGRGWRAGLLDELAETGPEAPEGEGRILFLRLVRGANWTSSRVPPKTGTCVRRKLVGGRGALPEALAIPRDGSGLLL